MGELGRLFAMGKERHGVVASAMVADPPKNAVDLRGVVEHRLVLAGAGYDTLRWLALTDGAGPWHVRPRLVVVRSTSTLVSHRTGPPQVNLCSTRRGGTCLHQCVPPSRNDARRLEVVANGAQFVVDTTLFSSVQANGHPHSHCAQEDDAAPVCPPAESVPELSGAFGRGHLVALATETKGRWSHEAHSFVFQLAERRHVLSLTS